MPETMISEKREYWLPTSALMFSHFGFAGSAGGLSGSKAMWQEPQEVPIRNGGSIEPSSSRLTCASPSLPLSPSLRLYPCQVARLPLSLTHASRLKFGLGNLRIPSAPVEVPNFRSHAD